jgi:hypothetical protein
MIIEDNNTINNYIEKRLLSMKKITSKNEISGIMIMVFLLCQIFSFVFMIFIKGYDYIFTYSILGIGSAISFIEFFLIAIHQNSCKKGNLLFDELSEELEVSINIKNNNSYNLYKEIRHTIKRYSSSTELPLIQGKYGSTLYFIITLVIYLVMIIVLYTKRIV